MIAGRPEPARIGWPYIWWQVKKDLLAKEVQTTPTYSYQWMACQMGHLTIGLLLGILPAWIRMALHPPPAPELSRLWASVLVLAGSVMFAAVKETTDVVREFKKGQDVYTGGTDKKDITLNGLTATGYMLLGGIVFWTYYIRLPPWLFLIETVAAILPARYWLAQKIRFQQVGLPFLFRLADLKTRPKQGSPADVMALACHPEDKRRQHNPGSAVICGAINAGKTSLAVGIGTEAAFSGRRARYLTFAKLLAYIAGKEPHPPRNTRLWAWESAEILIIDDVYTAAQPPEEVAKLIQGLSADARSCLAARQTVWVLDGDRAKMSGLIAAIEGAIGQPVQVFDVEMPTEAGQQSMKRAA